MFSNCLFTNNFTNTFKKLERFIKDVQISASFAITETHEESAATETHEESAATETQKALDTVKQLQDEVNEKYGIYNEILLKMLSEEENANQTSTSAGEFFAKAIYMNKMIIVALELMIDMLPNFNSIRLQYNEDMLQPYGTRTCCPKLPQPVEDSLQLELQKNLSKRKVILADVYIDKIITFCSCLTKYRMCFMQEVTKLNAVVVHPNNQHILTLERSRNDTSYCN